MEISRLAQEQRALRRVATLVASEASPESVFMAVSAECARVLGVSASSVWRYEGDDTATVVGRYNRDGIDSFPLGARLFVDETTSMGLARETAAPARVEDWGTSEGELAGLMLQLGYRSTVSAPIIVAGTLWGAVTIGSADPLPSNTEFRLSAFCDLVSLAVASAQAREDLQTSRARIVRAGDEQRRRLERNLHDGAQQRLVAATLLLRVAQAQLDKDRDGGDASCSRTPPASSTPGSRSCASSHAGSTRAHSPSTGSAAHCCRSRTACRCRSRSPSRRSGSTSTWRRPRTSSSRKA